MMRAHEIDELDRTLRCLESSRQDQRAFEIAALETRGPPGWADQPAAMRWLTEQCRKTCRRIETRQTEPVDRAVAPNQRGRAAITDQRVILDSPALSHPWAPASLRSHLLVSARRSSE